MKVVKGKFRQFFELDLKDKETEEFFKSLGEKLRMLAGNCLNEKPWNLKSPIIEYSPYYFVRCKICSSSKLNNLKVGEYFNCEIRPYHAFCRKTKGITLTVNKVLR